MKLIFAFIFSLVFLNVFSQKNKIDSTQSAHYKSIILGKYNYDYDSSNVEYYNLQINPLIESGNIDSIDKAIKIIRGITHYDTELFDKFSYKKKLKKIKKINLEYFEKFLIGNWGFKNYISQGLGTSDYYGVSTYELDTNHTMIFDGKRVSFYNGDTLLRKTKYKVSLTKFNNMTFEIYLKDKKEYISYKLEKSSKDKPTALIDYNSICACGCTEYFYERKNK